MAIFDDHVRQQAKKEFEKLQNNVKLVVFTQELECQYCKENRMLAEEIAALSYKVTTEVYNFAIDKEKAKAYKIDKIPAIVVERDKDYGIRFYGIPAGYEFTSLIEAIKIVSARDSGLFPESKESLKKITEPLHKTIVNEKIQFEGALPKSAFVSQLLGTIKETNKKND